MYFVKDFDFFLRKARSVRGLDKCVLITEEILIVDHCQEKKMVFQSKVFHKTDTDTVSLIF